MRLRSTMPAALITLLPASLPAVAQAQSSYMAPDNKNRFPGVTIFCPDGDGVMPCNFGASTNGGTVTLSSGGTLVSASHALPVGDVLMDALIAGGALTVGGTVSVANFPATQLISGAVSQAGSWTVTCSNCGTASAAVSGSAGTTFAASAAPPVYSTGPQMGSMDLSGAQRTRPTIAGVDLPAWPTSQSGNWTVGISALPALPAGGNAIGSVIVSNLPAVQAVSGSVTVSNLPATQPVSAASLPLPSGAALASLQPALNADGGSLAHVTNFPATQPVSGSVTVSNLPATQQVSAASLPLPSGAAVASLQPALNADGGSLAHVTNFPSVQAVSGAVSQSGSWTVGIGSMPALPAGTNTIGSVTVGNFPATQPVSAASLPLPSGAALASLQPALNADGGSLAHITNFPGVQAVTGAVSQSGSWSVSVNALPALPAGTNTIGAVTVANFPSVQPVSSATNAPVAPASPTATSSTLHGCVYNSPPPNFTNGQQGAVQCDQGGHLIPGAPVQQSMQAESPVIVPANTSTLVWTASAAARTLKIIPESQNTSCRLNDTGSAAASTNGFVIPAGYVWNLIEPPPTTNIYAYCTTTATIDISQGN